MADRHTASDVVDTALRLLDDEGLPELTMRHLATALGVQASALYWHFPNKQTLLARVSDRIVARSDRPVDGDWMPATTARAHALRDALLAYRDGAEVVSSSLALGLGGTQAIDLLEAEIARSGAPQARVAAESLVHFILGHVSHEQQRLQADSLGVVADAAPSTAGSFEFGVRLIVAGFDAVVAQRKTPQREPRGLPSQRDY